jgi:predicted GIY-YIG superfamily endonuclease
LPQLLLFPDPRPLVDKLGADFFHAAPECPGVYLMRDGAGGLLYVGKAKNLRKRLANYRVANPDRMGRRHLKLLRAVNDVELRPAQSEEAALAHEAELLKTLKPKFNRAGTWVGAPRRIIWRVSANRFEIEIGEVVYPGWFSYGPIGGNLGIRATLIPVLWCGICPERGLAQMPCGWFAGKFVIGGTIATIPGEYEVCNEAATSLKQLFAGDPEPFVHWVARRTVAMTGAFERKTLDDALTSLLEWAARRATSRSLASEPACSNPD